MMGLPAKVDTRTCRQIQTEQIADLQAHAEYAAIATERLWQQLEALAQRVTALEAQVSDTSVITWSNEVLP